MKCFIVKSDTFDACVNLAIEDYLVSQCNNTQNAYLYLWQNEKTVVIGRHQNVYAECNIPFINKNHISIVRRKTGGGAVYQDLGNLNFTIITPKKQYDIKKSTMLIVNALNKLAIEAYNNGRNDIYIENYKISGNAYRVESNAGVHHGTLIYDINYSDLEHCLKVSLQKLRKHGIKSVRSRVKNIKEIYPNVSLNDITKAVIKEFLITYNSSHYEELHINTDSICIFKNYYLYKNFDWTYRQHNGFQYEKTYLTNYGEITFLARYKDNVVKKIEIISDSLDVNNLTAFIIELNKANDKYFDSIKTINQFKKINTTLEFKEILNCTERFISELFFGKQDGSF